MDNLGAKDVAAVDSCLAFVRARQHCIARHRTSPVSLFYAFVL